MSDTKVHIEVTPEQANHISRALEVYLRLGIGQIETIDEMVRMEEISTNKDESSFNITVIDNLCNAIKHELGHPSNGSNGIFNSKNSQPTQSCYEIMKVLNKTMVEWRNPNPNFKGVDYDGLSFRLTKFSKPVSYVEHREQFN